MLCNRYNRLDCSIHHVCSLRLYILLYSSPLTISVGRFWDNESEVYSDIILWCTQITWFKLVYSIIMFGSDKILNTLYIIYLTQILFQMPLVLFISYFISTNLFDSLLTLTQLSLFSTKSLLSNLFTYHIKQLMMSFHFFNSRYYLHYSIICSRRFRYHPHQMILRMNCTSFLWPIFHINFCSFGSWQLPLLTTFWNNGLTVINLVGIFIYASGLWACFLFNSIIN